MLAYSILCSFEGFYTLKTEYNILLRKLSEKLRFSLYDVLLSKSLKLPEPFPSRISPRPISNHQLNTLLCLHPGPIYLVVFKGSYVLPRDISS